MAKKESETFAESQLLDELLEGKRLLQAHVAQSLLGKVRPFLRLSTLVNTTPGPAVLEQFVGSFDALEERLARLAGLRLKSRPNQRSLDLDRRAEAIGPKRREIVRRGYLSTLRTLGINDAVPLTVQQRRQLKALLRKGLEGLGADLGRDQEFLKVMLTDLIEHNS